MKILVRTAGLLGKHLPPGPVRNRAEIDVPSGSTITDVMKRLGFPEGQLPRDAERYGRAYGGTSGT